MKALCTEGQYFEGGVMSCILKHMDKRARFGVGIIGLLIIGAVVFVLISPTPTPTQDSMVDQAPTKSEPTYAQSAPQRGVYKDYAVADFEASSQRTRVLFFHAAWCPQCRALDADIRDGTVPDDVTIYKVDYDTNQALRTKYGVTLQTTLVKVDAAGNLVQKYVAYESPKLTSVRQYLQL
jgi:thiol-disulfide isomerase/thioredoxin